MQTLDDIRAEIVVRRDRWATESRVADQNHALAIAELEAHDRAVAAMLPNGAAQPAPARKERRDIAALVLAALTDQPQTADLIAHAIGVQTGRVEAALDRLAARHEAFEGEGEVWRRVR